MQPQDTFPDQYSIQLIHSDHPISTPFLLYILCPSFVYYNVFSFLFLNHSAHIYNPSESKVTIIIMEQVSRIDNIITPVEEIRNTIFFEPNDSQDKISSLAECKADVDAVEIEEIAAALDPDISDSNNPQNWPIWKKGTIFLALLTSSILCDGGMIWGSSLFVAQALEWKITLAKSSTSVNWGILLQGFGGILAVPLIETCGR